jgi:hypothetical protein
MACVFKMAACVFKMAACIFKMAACILKNGRLHLVERRPALGQETACTWSRDGLHLTDKNGATCAR